MWKVYFCSQKKNTVVLKLMERENLHSKSPKYEESMYDDIMKQWNRWKCTVYI